MYSPDYGELCECCSVFLFCWVKLTGLPQNRVFKVCAAARMHLDFHIKHQTIRLQKLCTVLMELCQWSYIGWQNWNLLSHPNATQVRQARARGENLNYVTLAPQARQANFEEVKSWATCWVTILTSYIWSLSCAEQKNSNFISF